LKHFKLFAVLSAFIFLTSAYSQDEVGSSRSTNTPTQQEVGRETYQEADKFYPAHLEEQHKQALENGRTNDAKQIEMDMQSKIPSQNKFPTQYNINDDQQALETQPPFIPDWYNTDPTVYAGAIKFGDPYFRQIDMKMGDDGNMYIALNRAPVSGANARIDVYRSSNGGANWVYCNGVTSATAYYGTVSLLVEVRGTSPDSARIFVFYTRSAAADNNDATMNFASFRRDGAAFYSGQIAAPPAGQEYSFTSAVSDGAFWTTATYVGVMCTESNNALTATNNFRFYRSQNWGDTWTGVTVSTAFDDFYPSAEYVENTADSVFIAVERRLSATQYEIRVIRTPWSPTASSNTTFVTSGGSNVKYEKPALTVKQNSPVDSMLFTVTKNGVSYYCPSVNAGASWSTDFTLGGPGNGNNKSFTWCASSYNGPDPFSAMWISNDGDSINLRLGGRIGNLGADVYKRNSNSASTSVAPTCIVYTPNPATNRSAFSYAGFGPTNIYANQEDLITAIQPVGNQSPVNYKLEQNYPNPFNPVTNIKFSIPNAGSVKLVVFDMLGKEVATLVNQNMNIGTYNVDFDAASLSSGVYFYKLTTGDFTSIKKMMLVK
jgi:hypothetical protein